MRQFVLATCETKLTTTVARQVADKTARVTPLCAICLKINIIIIIIIIIIVSQRKIALRVAEEVEQFSTSRSLVI